MIRVRVCARVCMCVYVCVCVRVCVCVCTAHRIVASNYEQKPSLQNSVDTCAYVRAHTRVHMHVGTAHRARRPSHRLALCLLIMCCPPRIARIGAYQLGFSNLVTVQYGIRSYIAYIYGSGQPYEHEQAPAVLVRIIEMDL
jgi:hypothetical protein